MSSGPGASERRCWIVSPLFDLCFIVNGWWLLFLLPQTAAVGLTQSTSIEFWQVYFLTAPHRWITLALVATDPDRREGRGWVFTLLAIVAAVAVLGVWWGFESFNCLVLVDYLWNAWHFGSQHGGVLRIYGRMGGGGRPTIERWTFRVFVTYMALRTAGWLTGWTEHTSAARDLMHLLDYGVFVLPVILIGLELVSHPWQRPGKVAYLFSVVVMYTVLLVAIRGGDRVGVIVMTAATAAFHAVEYLAIVTYYAWRRERTGSPRGAFRIMARHWLRILALYMILLGMVSQYIDRSLRDLYIGFNLWAAYLHYAYDGMIWKLRRPDTARALDVQIPSVGRAATGPVVGTG